MTTEARNFFVQNFWTPASATWNDLKNGAQRSFTKDDITNCLWNSLIWAAPAIAGGGADYVINIYAHEAYFLTLFTAGSVIAGATVSFFVVKFLSANHVTLSPFTADKALKLDTLHTVTLATINPLAGYFNLPYLTHLPVLFGTLAVAGYFGERSLYVIGALSALYCAVNTTFIQLALSRSSRSAFFLHKVQEL